MREFIILLLLGLILLNIRRKRYKDTKYRDSSIILNIPPSNTLPTFMKPGIKKPKSHIRVLSMMNREKLEYQDKQIIWNNLSPIMDQGSNCGSCFAYSASSMFTDRLRIRYGFRDIISPFSLAACLVCPYDLPNGIECSEACDGNYLDIVTQHLVTIGADIEHTDRYVCNIRSQKIKARKAYKVNIWDYFDYMGSSDEMKLQYMRENETIILNEIEKNGPVSGILQICIDEGHNFYLYKGGIYGADRHRCIKDAGFHAIVIIGSGTENGVKYWLCRNSWGDTSWGEAGFFRIIRGIDYLLIESDVHAVEV